MRTPTAQEAHASPAVGYLGDTGISFREFAMREPLPLSTIQDAVFEFLQGRKDTIVFGAQAVNAHVQERRAAEDVDLASTRGLELAEELRAYLNERFKIAVRVREVRGGIGYLLYQVRKEGNRHLVDVRPVEALPPSQPVGNVLVATPAELIAGKLLAWVGRQGKPKAYTDRRDLAVLLLAYPELKTESGAVRDRLAAACASAAALEAWSEVVREEIRPNDEDDEF